MGHELQEMHQRSGLVGQGQTGGRCESHGR